MSLAFLRLGFRFYPIIIVNFWQKVQMLSKILSSVSGKGGITPVFADFMLVSTDLSLQKAMFFSISGIKEKLVV